MFPGEICLPGWRGGGELPRGPQDARRQLAIIAPRCAQSESFEAARETAAARVFGSLLRLYALQGLIGTGPWTHSS